MLDRITFIDYMRIPIVIAERIFGLNDKPKVGLMSEAVFAQCMTKILVGDFQTRAKFCFQLYDFDNDGFITKEDCRFVLSYLPLSFLQNLATRQSKIFMQRTAGPSGFGTRSHSQSNSGSKYAGLDDTYERVQLNT